LQVNILVLQVFYDSRTQRA